MILIFCREYENTIATIIDWLALFKKEYLVFTNHSEIDVSIKLSNNEEKFFLNDIDIDEVNSVYYRNGEILQNIVNFNFSDSIIEKKIKHYLDEEWNVLRDFLFDFLEKKNVIGNYNLRYFNKLSQLLLAKKCNLKIPFSLIGSKNIFLRHLKGSNKITKPLGDIFWFSDNNIHLSSYTERVDDNIIDKKKDRFFPSFIQKEVEKLYELRIFFLGSKLFPMAIFSNSNKVDIRESNLGTEKRLIPYILEDEIKYKLLEFIKKSKLNTGSLDMIVSKQKEYYFLEVNPCGQFEYLSKYCNYNIEKEIALELAMN